MTPSETLRAARIAAKLSQKALGEALGYGDTAQAIVSRWEMDGRKIPQHKLKQIAKILKIPLDTLIP